VDKPERPSDHSLAQSRRFLSPAPNDPTMAEALVTLTTPLKDKETLHLLSMRGTEGVSSLFRFQLELASLAPDIDFSKILGKKITVEVKLEGGKSRFFNGFVNRFAQGGRDSRGFHYYAEIVPWLHFLTRRTNCRVFNRMSVLDIVQKVFDDHPKLKDFRVAADGEFNPVQFKIQYRESDFNFVSRLLEADGIYYFFEHTADGHKLVLGDGNISQVDMPGDIHLQFRSAIGTVPDTNTIYDFRSEFEVRSQGVAFREWQYTENFARKGSEATQKTFLKRDVAQVDFGDALQLYDFIGDSTTLSRGPDMGDNSANGKPQPPGNLSTKSSVTVAQMSFREEGKERVLSGMSTAPAMTAGHTFAVDGHFRAELNTGFVAMHVEHEISTAVGGEGGATKGQFNYKNRFRCIEATEFYSPPLVTPVPVIVGAQTAMVVTPDTNDPFVDVFGSVKIRFLWDRENIPDNPADDDKTNDSSSCWVRVAQAWAGFGYGAVFLPRRGMEVVVHFLEGNLDRPVIVGCLYSVKNPPPADIVDREAGITTRSGFRTRSTPGKADGQVHPGFNEIRFEDKLGKEQVFIHAQKDMDMRVGNDFREFVAANRSFSVGANYSVAVKKKVSVSYGDEVKSGMKGPVHGTIDGDSFASVGGAYHLTTGAAFIQHASLDLGIDGAVKIDTGAFDLGAGDMKIQGGTIHLHGTGDLVVKGANTCIDGGGTIYIKGGTVVIEGTQVSLKAGPSFVDIGSGGVSISGPMVKLNAGGAAASGTMQTPTAPATPTAPTAPGSGEAPKTADDGSKGGSMD